MERTQPRLARRFDLFMDRETREVLRQAAAENRQSQSEFVRAAIRERAARAGVWVAENQATEEAGR